MSKKSKKATKTTKTTKTQVTPVVVVIGHTMAEIAVWACAAHTEKAYRLKPNSLDDHADSYLNSMEDTADLDFDDLEQYLEDAAYEMAKEGL